MSLAFASARNNIGQIAVSTITPDTTISNPWLGCVLYLANHHALETATPRSLSRVIAVFCD